MYRTLLKTSAVAALAALATACNPIDFEDDWMDSPSTEDPAVSDDVSYLVSAQGEPAEEDKDAPVIVLVHGWQGSTYAWSEFADYARERGALVSNVLLGGHGRSTEAWLATDADDWAAPIRDEHARLSELGYTNINFALSMAANALFVRLLEQGELDGLTAPRNVAMLSPHIINQDKLLYTSAVIGPVLNNVPGKTSEEEKRLWYTNRPHQLLIEFANMLAGAEEALRTGDVALPEGTRAHIWVAAVDKISDVAGVDLLQHSLVSGEAIERTTVNTQLQTFWRGIGRPRVEEEGQHVWTDDDQQLAEDYWAEFYDFLTAGDGQ
jgi:carboxylesterase